MKKLFFILFFVPALAFAQKDKFVLHRVVAKESLSSIGRKYSISPKELASYNGLNYNKGLAIGQVLKIPVNKNNGQLLNAQSIPPIKKTVAPAEKSVPIYHTVASKETLYHISMLYNKVPIDNLKKWNHLTNNSVTQGQKLIVGYSSKGATATESKDETTAAKETEKIEKENNVVVKPVAEKMPAKEEMPQPENKKASNFESGIFKSIYEEQANDKRQVNEKGTAGIFKSTSGWQDGKYYCLHNSATVGTIIKIANNVTGKFVYAKVLDMIPDIKQNDGVIIRISNAAADVLGAMPDGKFDCTLSYSK